MGLCETSTKLLAGCFTGPVDLEQEAGVGTLTLFPDTVGTVSLDLNGEGKGNDFMRG